MLIKDSIKENFPRESFDDFYVVADFDKTITTGSSKTSWSVLAGSDLVPTSYKDERDTLYEKYRPIELDETMDFKERSALIKEWFKSHVELFVKYKVSEEIFKTAASDYRIMEFREGAKEFIDFLHEHNIPLIIISAGIGNFIECFLRNNGCYYDNIYVSSNKIIFENGIAVGVENNIIHSLNKNEVSLPDEIKERLAGRSNVVLLGDQKSDLRMVDENDHDCVVKVGFLTNETEDQLENYGKYFDIVVDTHENYTHLMNALIKS